MYLCEGLLSFQLQVSSPNAVLLLRVQDGARILSESRGRQKALIAAVTLDADGTAVFDPDAPTPTKPGTPVGKKGGKGGQLNRSSGKCRICIQRSYLAYNLKLVYYAKVVYA